MTRSQSLALAMILSLVGAGVYLWISPDGLVICGLPSLGDPAIYAALRVDEPTINAKGDRCLPALEAAKLGRRVRLLSGLIPQWQAVDLPPEKCVAVLVALEADLDDQDVPDAAVSRQAIVQICGPAPDLKGDTAVVPGASVQILSVLRFYARLPEVPVIRIVRPLPEGRWPIGISAIVDCACSTGTNCQELRSVPGQVSKWTAAARTGNALRAGAWRGSDCIRMACVESAMWSPGHSLPRECRP